MKKEQYLMLLKKKDIMGLIYVYALESNTTIKIGPFENFKMKFIAWNIKAEKKQELYDRIRDFYDKKFGIQITTYNDKIINFQ